MAQPKKEQTDFGGVIMWMLKEYEKIRIFRKSIKGKPTEEQRIQLDMDKEFERYLVRMMD